MDRRASARCSEVLASVCNLARRTARIYLALETWASQSLVSRAIFGLEGLKMRARFFPLRAKFQFATQMICGWMDARCATLPQTVGGRYANQRS